jgi:NADH-quinone oxidoreductase subunit D
MSELLLPPEHRYAKINERLNEDGRAFDLEFRSYSPCYTRYFQNILLMDGERILEAEPTIGYIHRAFEKSLKTVLLPNYPLTDRMNYCSSYK